MAARIPAWAHYRKATEGGVACGTCDFFDGTRNVCEAFQGAPVEPKMVCDRWSHRVDKAEPGFTGPPEDRYAGLSEDDISLLATAGDALEPSQVIRKEGSRMPIRLADDARIELARFWRRHPDLRDDCVGKYGHDPLAKPDAYWPYGLSEPEHRDVLAAVKANGGLFTLALVKRWEREEIAEAKVEKAQARGATLHLRIHGMSKTSGGMRVYRMVTRDGHYVGRTNATRVRARKGDVLKVQAEDLLQTAQGDMQWVNPNVVSGYQDGPPHSWRELEAYAGGAVVKDGAPGPAGDLPPAGDEGNSSGFPSGPTLDAVHVNTPLPDISVAYTGTAAARRRAHGNSVLQGEFLPITKAQAKKQLVYGVVLEPNSLDSQDDFMLPHQVERTAHGYLKRAIRGTSSVAKLQHRRIGFKKQKPSIVPVESFIAPCDFTYDGMDMIKKGTWVMVMHVEDPNLWQDFLNGKYTGFSVGGSGIRRAMTGPGLVPHGLIGRQEPNYFRPNPADSPLVRGG